MNNWKTLIIKGCRFCPSYSDRTFTCSLISAKRNTLTSVPKAVLRRGEVWEKCPLASYVDLEEEGT
ncbi:MAG: hypothetical protein WBL02_03400 [Methanomethylovorans sp.]|uniref:hypothetical protein n=1 Tax=Methanomethylovorans sp. TaxID=2758717 RepID=UPI001BD6A67F|nr:hypothetical protein [Methanomethylovorans sp.]